ncbi:hypothetical protein D3C86_1573230 [compost metagenome]
MPELGAISFSFATFSSMTASSFFASSCLPKISPSLVMLPLTLLMNSLESIDMSMAGVIFATSGYFARERPPTMTRSASAALIAS